MTTVFHVITPGDHFSPRTGSAIPTVVDGLARACRADPAGYEHVVVLDRTTYSPRYDSADVLEYAPAPASGRAGVYADYARAAVGARRAHLAAAFAPAVHALRSQEPGIVIAHNAPIVGELLDGSGHRVILHAHNRLPASMRPHEARRWLGPVDAVVCVSADLADATRARLPRSLHPKVRAVPHGVDTARFAPSPRPAGPTRFVFVGRTIPSKGADVLVEAAVLLARQDIEVEIVGSHGFDPHAPLTRHERDLRERAASARTPVTFRPFTDRSALPALLASAHALVVPSRWREPAGLTVGEGMAAGAVVIASRVGGIPELLGDAGVLVRPDDPKALAAAMARVADDPAEREALARAGRARAEQRDWAWAWRLLRDVLDESLTLPRD